MAEKTTCNVTSTSNQSDSVSALFMLCNNNFSVLWVLLTTQAPLHLKITMASVLLRLACGEPPLVIKQVSFATALDYFAHYVVKKSRYRKNRPRCRGRAVGNLRMEPLMRGEGVDEAYRKSRLGRVVTALL